MQPDLFPEPAAPRRISEGAVILPGFALDHDLLPQVDAIAAQAPFRHFQTPGGRQIGVEMTNAGPLGWVSDRRGYRYQPDDPLSGKPWPAMPPAFLDLAMQAAAMAGFAGFRPDACLINRYRPGVRMGLHQDRDEADLGVPIVSVSLGLPVTFQFGGTERGDPIAKHRLAHGDVVVWGGPSRLAWHGVLTLRQGQHPMTGAARINLTFRRACL